MVSQGSLLPSVALARCSPPSALGRMARFPRWMTEKVVLHEVEGSGPVSVSAGRLSGPAPSGGVSLRAWHHGALAVFG